MNGYDANQTEENDLCSKNVTALQSHISVCRILCHEEWGKNGPEKKISAEVTEESQPIF